jgi:hypothetical protein
MGKNIKKSKKVVIFEDTQESLKKFKSKLDELFSERLVDIVDFKKLYEDKKEQKLFTDNMKIQKKLKIIFEEDTRNPIEMVIVDLELSQFEEFDISEPVISNVCDILGIPTCLYSRVTDEYEIERIRNWSERHIVLDSNKEIDDIAKQCYYIFEGFQAINEEVRKIDIQKSFSPIEIISKIMKAPEGAESQIVHYTTGYFSLMGKRLKDASERARFLSVLLGYWIYNSLLRFPGVLLNETAAASYLNIDVESFRNSKEIKNAFKEARYMGPFNGIAPYWWKVRLDELLSKYEEDAEEGVSICSVQAFLRQKGIDNVSPVRCVEGNHEGAGFYCIITKDPVCAEHSTGNIAWLPPGAIHSRICNSKWEELAPWFGF